MRSLVLQLVVFAAGGDDVDVVEVVADLPVEVVVDEGEEVEDDPHAPRKIATAKSETGRKRWVTVLNVSSPRLFCMASPRHPKNRQPLGEALNCDGPFSE